RGGGGRPLRRIRVVHAGRAGSRGAAEHADRRAAPLRPGMSPAGRRDGAPAVAVGWLWAACLAVTIVAPREFSHWRVPLGPVHAYPLDLLLAVSTLALLADPSRRTQDAWRPLLPLALPAGAWVLWGLGEFARGVTASLTARAARDLAINAYVWTLPLVTWLLARGRAERPLRLAVLAGAMALTVKGIAYAFLGHDILPESPGYALRSARYLTGAESCYLSLAALAVWI